MKDIAIVTSKSVLLVFAVAAMFMVGCQSITENRSERETSHPLAVDGSATDVYRMIRDRGFNYEVPDHPNWGNHHDKRHIEIEFDSFLDMYVLALSVCHNDRVIDTWMNRSERGRGSNDLLNSLRIDRQRNELKTDASTPEWGRAREGHEVVYHWKFKLPEGFVASSSFTHIHQLKAVGGDEAQPIITLTVRHRTGATSIPEMQLIYSSATGSQNINLLERIPLAGFIGEWVQVEQRVVYSRNRPAYEFTATRMRDGQVLMHFVYDPETWAGISDLPFRTIRPDNNFVRPKWGIYRAILRRVGGELVPVTNELRDETVRFAGIEIVNIGR